MAISKQDVMLAKLIAEYSYIDTVPLSDFLHGDSIFGFPVMYKDMPIVENPIKLDDFSQWCSKAKDGDDD